MAGIVDELDRPRKKVPNPVEDQYKLYNTAVKQQAGDYDDIMSRFKQLYGEGADNGPNSLAAGFTPYSPSLATYKKSPDTIAALGNLRELTQTGGLSAGDIQNLRSRGVSPIRSMYSTAQRDLNRQRSLSGGYSPNYGAVTAKMTRDMSSQIADQMDKVNAGIAQMVQSGRLQTAPQYAGASQQESELGNKFELENAATKNEASRYNLSALMGLRQQDRANSQDSRRAAVQGMTNLYGTTPALSNLYGTQAQNTAQFQNNVNQQKKRTATELLGSMVRH